MGILINLFHNNIQGDYSLKKYISIEEYYKKESNNEYKKSKKIIRNILIVICLSIFFISIYTIITWNIDNFKIKKINEEIKEETILKSLNDSGELINPPEDYNSNYYYFVKMPFYQCDFSNLLNKNSDTVAFIHINNTLIHYPVVKTNDNNYYLNHSFDKQENKAGWIFMDYRNNIDELSDNTIIYGHRRLDGTMFGTLKNMLLPSWQNNKDNYVIFISTLKENYLFQIFSIYVIEKENYYIKTDFNGNSEKQKWIDTMKQRNMVAINTEVNINDKFLTLSTCYNNNEKRLVVHAKLIKKQKNKKMQ